MGHGTHGGWVRHRRAKETPCAACTAARNEYRRTWRHTRRLLGLVAS